LSCAMPAAIWALSAPCAPCEPPHRTSTRMDTDTDPMTIICLLYQQNEARRCLGRQITTDIQRRLLFGSCFHLTVTRVIWDPGAPFSSLFSSTSAPDIVAVPTEPCSSRLSSRQQMGKGKQPPRQFLPTETVKFIAPSRDQTTTRVILHDLCKPSGLEVYLRIEHIPFPKAHVPMPKIGVITRFQHFPRSTSV